MENKQRTRKPAKAYSQRLDGTRTRYQHKPTTDERIITLRKELGMDLKQAARQFSLTLGLRAIAFNL